MNAYLLSIVIYALILIAVGFIVTRRVKGASDFFVAGRKLGPALLFTTLIAPNIGGGSTVGVAGLGYKFGVSAWWWIGASALGSFILAVVVGPAIWRIAKKYNLYTLGDYLDFRYNRNFRGLISLLLAVGSLAIFAGQLMGIAWILGVVAGTDKSTGILLAALVVVLYFGAGGLLSAAFVNIIQIIVKFFGFLLAVPFVLSYVGGWEGLNSMIAQNMAAQSNVDSYFSYTGMGLTMIIGYFLMLTPSFFISPGLIGKVYGAKDEHTVRLGTALNAFVQLLFAMVPVVLGMCAFAIFPDLTDRELALPTVLKEILPFWVSALALAAIFSAEVSAADAILYMVTTSFTKDLYKTFVNPNISDKSLLKISRVVTFVAGAAGVVIALILPNIITALSIFYSLMSVSLTAPLLFGLFSRRPSTAAAFICAISGIAVTILLQFGNAGKGLWILNAQSTGVIVTLVIMTFMMYVFPAKVK
ncbi:MAG: sodium:solute symporter family protein [Veillonellaceae bacterium]|nr:sodium:solute symporter family protein [Veillonellaceae bacterium]